MSYRGLFLVGMLALAASGGSEALPASNNPCANANTHCTTWSQVLVEAGISAALPNVPDINEAISSGTVWQDERWFVGAYLRYGKAGGYYWLLSLDKPKGVWLALKVLSEEDDSIIWVKRLDDGFIVGHHGHRIRNFERLDREGRLLGEFQGLDFVRLPNGGILSLNYMNYGTPCLVSLHSMSRNDDRCVIDSNWVIGAPYSPDNTLYSGGVEARAPVYLYKAANLLALTMLAVNKEHDAGPWLAYASLDEAGKGGVLTAQEADTLLGKDRDISRLTAKQILALRARMGLKVGRNARTEQPLVLDSQTGE